MKANYENKNIITARTNSNVSYTVSTAYSAVKVPMTNVEYNLGECFELSDGNIKIKKAGYYKVSATIAITGASGGSTQVLELHKNNARVITAYQYTNSTAYTNMNLTDRIIYANVGDLITMKISSNVINTQYTVAGGAYTYMTIEKI